MDLDASPICFFRKPAKEVAQAPVEQRLEVSLLRAVGIELQEEIVADGWSDIEPSANSRGSRHVVTGDFSGFRPQYQPATEAQAERPGNHEQITLLSSSDGGFDSSIK